MSTAIDLRVNTSQINTARKAVADLSQQMSSFDQSSIDLGGESLARDVEMLRQASLDVTRLGSIARSGEARGGSLDQKQWLDAANLSKRVGENLGGWLKHTKDLRGELRHIKDDLDGLSKASHDPALSAKTRGSILTEMNSLEARKAEVDAELKNRGKLDARGEMLRKRAEEHGAAIEGYQVDSGRNAGASAASGMKRMALTTLGLAGIGGVVALIAEAVSKYRELEPAQADMSTLRLRPSGYGSHGYMLGERIALSRQLAAGGGWRDVAGAGDDAMRLARGRSMDVGDVGGFMTGSYRSTGIDKQTIQGMTAWIFANTKNGLRQTDVLTGILQLQQKQMTQQGGAVSAGQAAFLSAMFTGGFDKSVMLQATGAYDKLNSGMAAGGRSPGEQLLSWKLAGGDEFNGSFESIEKIKTAQKQGLGNEQYRKGMAGYLKGMDPAKARMALNAMYDLAPGKGNEADLMLDMLGEYGGASNDDFIKQWKAKGGKDANIAKVFANYKPSAVRGELAEQEGSLYGAGKVLGPPLQGLRTAVLGGGELVVKQMESTVKGLENLLGVKDGKGFKIATESIREWWDTATAKHTDKVLSYNTDKREENRQKLRQGVHDLFAGDFGGQTASFRKLEEVVVKILALPSLTPARTPLPVRVPNR
jgi:hypothetical protein